MCFIGRSVRHPLELVRVERHPLAPRRVEADFKF
jgi:hypothetical protein